MSSDTERLIVVESEEELNAYRERIEEDHVARYDTDGNSQWTDPDEYPAYMLERISDQGWCGSVTCKISRLTNYEDQAEEYQMVYGFTQQAEILWELVFDKPVKMLA